VSTALTALENHRSRLRLEVVHRLERMRAGAQHVPLAEVVDYLDVAVAAADPPGTEREVVVQRRKRDPPLLTWRQLPSGRVGAVADHLDSPSTALSSSSV
jgi:hypothetical protein